MSNSEERFLTPRQLRKTRARLRAYIKDQRTVHNPIPPKAFHLAWLYDRGERSDLWAQRVDQFLQDQ